MAEIGMPPDFAVEPYDSVFDRIANLATQYYRAYEAGAVREYQSWNQWVSAWIGVTYRYRSCTEHDEAFSKLVTEFGDNPNPFEKYRQDQELFNFFVTGLSAIECTCYGLFAVGSLLNSSNFPLATEKDMSSVNPAKTLEQFDKSFPKEGITAALHSMTSQPEYKSWKKVRNTLAHRISPGRMIYASVGGPSKTAEWKLDSIPMDGRATASRREWLANSLRNILTEADHFTAKHF
ncbi:MAG: hypothetical protein M3Q60_09745 [Actinomycetota bacterium]|nr:hypothetical protein [Actinomycetota bacterium]